MVLKTQNPKVFRAFNEGKIVVVYPFEFFVELNTDRTTDAFNVVAVDDLVMQPCQGIKDFIILELTLFNSSGC